MQVTEERLPANGRDWIVLYEYELYEVMDIEQCTPSLSQANRMKRMSQSESLDMDAMFSILEQEKAAGENVPYCCNMEVKLRGSNNAFS